ncbi:MAG: PolC-type DNA polymerase III [Clostridia bacterium]|nr:PolC-type DNA polymerase III [Clostridia bacterium]
MSDTTSSKGFFEIFSRYRTEGEKARLLNDAKNIKVRVCKQPLRVEVDADFDAHQNPDLLYQIESELCTLYKALSFRIFPHYDPTLFALDKMKEIADESVYIGAITKGFFYDPEYEDDGETITVRLPFLDAGIDLLHRSKTGEIIANILKSRYGVIRKIEICSSNDAKERTEENLRSFEKILVEREEEARRRMQAERKEQEKQRLEEEAARPKLAPSLTPERISVEQQNETTYHIGTAIFTTEGAELICGGTADPEKAAPVYIKAPTPIGSITEPKGNVVLFGEIFEIAEKESRNGERLTVTVGFGDTTSSIYLKKSQATEEPAWHKSLKAGKCIAVEGSVYRDKFDDELVCSPRKIYIIKKTRRKDKAVEKRVELHLHTNMSAMDAVITPADVIDTAIAWGHPAIAVTDHGNVQAFPEIMLAYEKAEKKMKEQDKTLDLKILYGIEAYYVNDTNRAIYGPLRPSFDDEMVVFDIETTGLSNITCKITEIGAVKIKGGRVIDTFDTFVNPEVHIPENITALTSITDEMVADAPKIKEALEAFFDFISDDLLIAHNASFDTGFIRVAAQECELPFNNTFLDTVSLSRYVNPELKKHKLDIIAEHYQLGDFHHHRASDDAAMLAEIFFCMVERLRKEGITDFNEMIDAMSESADPLKLKPRHMIILAKNSVGLKNLYRLISESYLTYYKRFPRMPRSLIEQNREGLIIGSACEAGELYQAILDGASDAELEEIAGFYDYLEIQPLCNNRFLIAEGKIADDIGIQNINRRIIALGKKLGIPTVATCDAHFLNREDEIYRKILLAGMKYGDADRDTGIYLRTTDEMLEEFSYLGEELAREVVIENPRKIADSIEKIRPIPEGKYDPKMEGAEEELTKSCWDRAHDWYGEKLPELVENRLNKELSSIIKNGFAVLYMIAVKLVSYSESLGYLVGSRGSVGSSFVATMSGISEVNPLPPHYRCKKCRYSEFITDGSYGSGFDLPDKNCPACGELLYADGHDIPFETFLGFYGEKSPDIDLNFSGDVQGRVHKYTEELFGAGHVFRAGTIGTLASKTAFGYVMKYLDEHHLRLPKAEVSNLVSHCVGIKRTTGQHPGGIIVVPKEYDIYDFSPVQHPADDPNSDIITTHFQFSYLHDTILKLDELGHDMPTKYKMLERYTNTSVMDVKMNDKAIYDLFQSTAPLGVTPKEIGCEVGTYGLPELGTRFIQQVLMDAKPKNFADLLQISGLTHGTNVWLGNAQDLIKAGICDISEVVGTRDGIMLYLQRHGLDNGMAFKIMEDVRKGKGLKPEYEQAMLEHDVPEWYIASCKKIKYMFPKAHAAAYVMSAIRLAWYKLHYPMEFYAAFLSVAPGGFDAEVVIKGRKGITERIEELEKKGNEATQKEAEEITTLLLVREAVCRGVQFLPVDLLKSDANAFLPEDGKIRMPFSSLGGLGETAAANIIAARNEGEIFSVEELRQRAGLTKAVIEILRRNKVLDSLSETNQFTLF